MKKIYAKRIIGSLLVIILSCCILNHLSTIVRTKDPWYRKSTFIDNSDDVDVLFFGTSHAVNAIFPMELWNEYGITSYNMAGHGNTIPNSYWIMMNSLDYANPKLIVLDCWGMTSPEKTSESYLHWSMDNFKLSKNKVYAINDLFPETSKRIEYLWDFSLYHSRWSDLSREDFDAQPYIQYGGEPRIAVSIPNELLDITTIEKKSFDTCGTEYLKKFIEECQARGIPILLTYLPFPATKVQVNESLVIHDIANEYGINYINFLELDVVNYDTDCYDEASHLNFSGAGKITKYIGSYIKSNYQIEDKRGNSRFHDWDENYELYKSYKVDTAKEQTDLATYLMLLRNKDISLCLYIKGNSDILKDKQIYSLIDNISIYQKLTHLKQACENKQDYFAIIDNGWEEIWECVGDESIINLNSTFGNINYFTENAQKVLYIQDSDKNYISESNNSYINGEIEIILIDKWTGEIIDEVFFVKNNNSSITKVQLSDEASK
ncbi:MAG: hypothetical protein NC429_02265 [Lachnospiraceae bacterium]|nr:hypothetical protein [Lachnospiraceae bacterium]